jgi:hypothetical protein
MAGHQNLAKDARHAFTGIDALPQEATLAAGIPPGALETYLKTMAAPAEVLQISRSKEQGWKRHMLDADFRANVQAHAEQAFQQEGLQIVAWRGNWVGGLDKNGKWRENDVLSIQAYYHCPAMTQAIAERRIRQDPI